MFGLWVLACRDGGLEAHITADVTSGVFPLEVTFDGATSLVPADGSYAWDFGDGGTATGATVQHTFVGAGPFDTTLTVADASGTTAETSVTVDVGEPECPTTKAPELWGLVGDLELDELSGIAASHREPGVFWVHQDNGKNPLLFGLDGEGRVLSSHDLDGVDDLEDIASVVDPVTGDPLLFLGDIGDNDQDRSEIAVYRVNEPDPYADGNVFGLRMALRYPANPPYNAETLLVDPRTLDLYIVTKDRDGEALVFTKRAPHEGSGPFTLEQVAGLSFAGGGLTGLTTTAGDVSPDGTRVVIRTYLPTAHLWIRDGYLPFEAAFDRPPCPLSLASETQGEAVAFTADGQGLVTVSEGESQPLYHIGL